MRIQDHFSISVNLDVGCGHRRVSVCSAQVCVPLGHSSLYLVSALDAAVYLFIHRDKERFPFDALTLLVGRQEGHLVCKKWVMVCCCWQFDWSFARHVTPVVTTTSIILSSNKIHNWEILVPANTGSPGNMAVKTDRERQRVSSILTPTTLGFLLSL